MAEWEAISSAWTEHVVFEGENYILSTKQIFNDDNFLKWELIWSANNRNLQLCGLNSGLDSLSNDSTLWLKYYIKVDSPMKCGKSSHVRSIGMLSDGCCSLSFGNCQMLQFDSSYSGGEVRFIVRVSSIITNVSLPDILHNVVMPCDSGLVKDISSELNNPELCNVKISVSETELNVHKFILCARSSVFRAMFQNDILENNRSLITINNFEVEIVKLLVRFMYEDHVTIPSMDTAEELLKAADYYNVVDLKELCVKYIAENVDQNNVLDVLLLSTRYGIQKLKMFSMEYFISYPKKYGSSDFRKIEQQKPDLLSDILAMVTDKYAENTLVLKELRTPIPLDNFAIGTLFAAA